MRDTVWCILIAVSFCVGYVSGRHDASGSDYTVSRGTTIVSERPIGLLVLEMGMGVLGVSNDGRTSVGRLGLVEQQAEARETALQIDGRPAPGIRGMARAGWRLLGFLLWDADGSIERVTDLKFRGRSVRIVDAVSNGRVWVRVTVGPPLGDKWVRCAVLKLSAVEGEHGALLARWLRADTTLRLSCSAVIDLPFDDRRERVHTRRERWGCDRPTLSERIADREAGPELSSRVIGLATAGRAAVLDGRGRLTDSVVAEFLERTCK